MNTCFLKKKNLFCTFYIMFDVDVSRCLDRQLEFRIVIYGNSAAGSLECRRWRLSRSAYTANLYSNKNEVIQERKLSLLYPTKLSNYSLID